MAGLADDDLVLILVFVVGWTLMTVAMMLPTSLPLVTLFRALVRRRPDGGVLVALVVIGYLAVWTLFAIVVHAGDRGIHAAVRNVAWLDDTPGRSGRAPSSLPASTSSRRSNTDAWISAARRSVP